MNKVVLGIFGLTISGFSHATAIESINANVTAIVANVDFEQARSADLNILEAELRYPLAKYLGLGFNFSGYKSKFSVPSGSLKSTNLSSRLELLLRDSEIGSIAFSAERDYTKFNGSSNKDYDTTYDINAQYFINAFTVSVSRTRQVDDAMFTYNTSELVGSWYPVENINLSASISGMDANDLYSIEFSHQPEWTQNKGSWMLSYGTNRATNEESDLVLLGVKFHFNSGVSLKTRDRKY